jgi:hypothetical protein
MSEIQRLLRVAARRNKATEYDYLRVRLLKSQIAALREQLQTDGMSANVLIEAVVRGYLMRSPAVLAMIDHWRQDELPEKKRKASSSLSKKELNEIYAEIGSGMLDDEDA